MLDVSLICCNNSLHTLASYPGHMQNKKKRKDSLISTVCICAMIMVHFSKIVKFTTPFAGVIADPIPPVGRLDQIP